MDDELDKFLAEQKAKVAADKISLLQDPPYMEMRRQGAKTSMKENLPPQHQRALQKKDECTGLSLPLGQDYEHKKHRLQQELRLDYRRYMAQKHLLSGPVETLCERRSPKMKDAATLTDPIDLTKRTLPHSKESYESSEEELRFKPRRHQRQHRVATRMSEHRVDLSDEFTDTHIPPTYHSRRPSRVQVYAGAKNCEVSRTHSNNQESTGLIIDSTQHKKDHYRQELEEQIAEQQRNRRREKEDELGFATSGVADPEKLPSHSIQFVTESCSQGNRGLQDLFGEGEGEQPPPEHPHLAFQSPLLEYSSALGLRDTPRMPLAPPAPPSMLSDAYRTPYDDAYYYYGARHPLDPTLPYYGPLFPLASGGPRLSSQIQQQSGSNTQTQLLSEPGVFPAEKQRPRKETELSYRDALRQQIEEKAERRRLDREQMQLLEARVQEEFRTQQPWGRGGGGAPLRDSTGNLIADLKQMHKLNEEAYMNPSKSQKTSDKVQTYTATFGDLLTDAPSSQKVQEQDKYNAYLRQQIEEKRRKHAEEREREKQQEEREERRIAEERERMQKEYLNEQEKMKRKVLEQDLRNAHIQPSTTKFARGGLFADRPSDQKLQEQEKYTTYLRKQIEEKRRIQAEERERERQHEDREERRIAKERENMQREYLEEQEKMTLKEFEKNLKNEELIQLSKEKKKEAERKKREEEEKENTAQKKLQEKERHTYMPPLTRQPSPPVPTLQRKLGQRYSPRLPTEVRSNTATSNIFSKECSVSGLQSPPVPARRNQLRAEEDRDGVMSELCALRQRLRLEERRLEGQLLQKADWEPESPVDNRRRVDVFDMARLRMQAPVRRPASRITEPCSIQKGFDVRRNKYRGLGSPDSPEDNPSQTIHRQQWHTGNNRRDQNDFYAASSSPPPTSHLRRNGTEVRQRGLVLESDSAFIDMNGAPFPLPPEEKKDTPISARERRRLKREQNNLWPSDGGSHTDQNYRRQDRNTHHMKRLHTLNRHLHIRGDETDDDAAAVTEWPL
ncbi:centrosome and spindle pole-associated protein 1 isoform X2 [Denticeps clupeoides]|uniref:centrosome and spindle pole-associated protein 1 isoform X2 n=1 Tax=Denticeps clupeoides TaxID=299321 RepID=UPI0010A5988D|nr:centrosome and spindle pole-associated protein 1-like isoform X2 [Denticeps clupeoides]